MVKRVVAPWVALRLAKRLARSVPFASAVIAAAVAGHSVRRKGWLRGVLHAGLDALPVVGAVKGTIEIFTGDWIPDRVPAALGGALGYGPGGALAYGVSHGVRPAPSVDEATVPGPPGASVAWRRLRARASAPGPEVFEFKSR